MSTKDAHRSPQPQQGSWDPPVGPATLAAYLHDSWAVQFGGTEETSAGR